jgi:hypothetical protein
MDLVRLSGGLLVKQKTKEERDKIKKKRKCEVLVAQAREYIKIKINCRIR